MRSFYNLPIRYKLLLSFLSILAIAVLFGIYLLISIHRIENSFASLSENNRAFNNFLTLELQNKNMNIAVRNFILTKDPAEEAQYDSLSLAFDNQLDIVKKQESDNAQNYAEVLNIEKYSNRIKDIELLVLAEVRAGNSASAQSLVDTTYYQQQRKIEDTIQALADRENQEVQGLIAHDKAAASLLLSITVAVLTVIILVVLLISLLISNLLSRSILELSKTAQAIADGNLELKARVGSGDEIGLLASTFNLMTSKLRDANVTLEKNVQEKTVELSEKVIEVEKSKSAILNLLEDVDEEKKKAEEMVVERTKELSEEKARLLASINSLSFGFALADANDNIIFKNPALLKTLDTGSDIRTVHDITTLLASSGSKVDIDLSTSCKRCMELKQPVEFKEVPYGKKFLRIICAPIVEGEATIGYIFLAEDITEAKVMERSRDEFFAVASHELRTPLTAIRGNADMILEMYADKVVDKDMKEMLQDINASSVRLINVVNDFLEVSRLEQGRIDIKKESFALGDVIEKVMRDLKAMVEKKGLQLVYTQPSLPMPNVLGDKNRSEQILVNLIGNSIKFTKEGSITVSLEPSAEFVKLRVADTGVGISEHNQALLFRKFQQAGEQMLARDVSQSTGLGLYICRLMLNAMGGEIGLEKSELGKGSVFYFTLPIAS